MVEKTAATGMTISDYENIALTKGGHITPVSATTSPLLKDNGEQIGTILILRDLTSIRDLERAVRQADSQVISNDETTTESSWLEADKENDNEL